MSRKSVILISKWSKMSKILPQSMVEFQFNMSLLRRMKERSEEEREDSSYTVTSALS